MGQYRKLQRSRQAGQLHQVSSATFEQVWVVNDAVLDAVVVVVVVAPAGPVEQKPQVVSHWPAKPQVGQNKTEHS